MLVWPGVRSGAMAHGAQGTLRASRRRNWASGLAVERRGALVPTRSGRIRNPCLPDKRNLSKTVS